MWCVCVYVCAWVRMINRRIYIYIEFMKIQKYMANTGIFVSLWDNKNIFNPARVVVTNVSPNPVFR